MADYSYNANADNFISITENGSGAELPRLSTLQITKAGLCVLGNLPHGYTFKPSNARERDRLCSYLQSLTFTEG